MMISAGFALAAAGALQVPANDPWSEDAKALLTVIEKNHPNPAHSTSIAKLRSGAARIERGEVEPIARLAEWVASVGDGHTLLPIFTLPFSNAPPGPTVRFLPVRFESFDDGLFIVGADRSLAHLIGARVESIGGVPAQELLRRSMRLLPHRTPRLAQEYAPEWLLSDIVLRHVGAASPDGGVVLQTSRGETEAQFRTAETQFDWLTSRTGGMTIDWVAAPEPVLLSGNGTALLNRATLYLRIEQVRPLPEQSWDQFISRAREQFGRAEAKRLILDLRDCIGGDGTLLRTLMDWLASEPALQEHGRLYALIGRRTHSACVMAVSALEQRTSALLVGQSTGDAPNHYGETNIFILPNARIPVIYSSRFWQTSSPDDRRPWVDPHVRIAFLHREFAARRDATLDWVLAQEVP